ncbi:MAG: hypothetical protein IJL80_05405, partial [Treponema sp.]|nr:hypothetical protein [Treponema sp.]
CLLDLYRSYKVKLSSLSQSPADDSFGKEPVTKETLKEGMELLSRYADDFDIDGADKVVAMLDAYTIPESFKDSFAKIKQYVNAADFTALSELLAGL